MHLAKKMLPPQVNNQEESSGRKRNFANYHFLSCWSTQGFSLIKLKEIKFNCNQLPRAPQKRSRGREGTGGTKHIRLLHHVHFCVFTSLCTSDDQVIGSQRISILRIQGSDALGLRTTHLDPRHILQAEGSSPFLPWLHPSSSAWQVQTCSHLLCMMAQKCHWACRCPQQGACPQRTYDPVAEKRLIWGEQPENNF